MSTETRDSETNRINTFKNKSKQKNIRDCHLKTDGPTERQTDIKKTQNVNHGGMQRVTLGYISNKQTPTKYDVTVIYHTQRSASNWILTSWQTQSVRSRHSSWWLKPLYIPKLFSSQSTKPVPTQHNNHSILLYIHTQTFEELVPSISPLLQKVWTRNKTEKEDSKESFFFSFFNA